jgi:holo-[acyl-carrier protein] synthase
MSGLELLSQAVSREVKAVGASMIGALGVDAVSIEHFARDIEFCGESYLAQCFSRAERDYCAGDIDQLATRFALKEAALKALGTGMRGIGLHDIEVETAATGEPRLRLSPDASGVARERGLATLHCTATREAGFALAVVVASLAQSQEDL